MYPPPPEHVKMKVPGRLHRLMDTTIKNYSKACHTYELIFDRRVKHIRKFDVGDMVHVDNSPAPKRHPEMTSTVKSTSVTLLPEKSGPYRMKLTRPHTVTANIDELHSIVAIARVTFLQAAQEINQDASGRNCDYQFSPEHETLLKKPLTVESVMENEANMAPKNDSLSPTAQGNAARPELRTQRTPTGREEQNSQQNMSSIKTPTAKLVTNARCNGCVGTAMVPATTPGSRQNTCRNSLMHTMSSACARTGGKASDKKSTENRKPPSSIGTRTWDRLLTRDI